MGGGQPLPFLYTMQKVDESLIDTIAKLADYFALTTVQRWSANIKRQKLISTGELLRSLDQETRADLSRLIVTLQFAYAEQGKFHDIPRKRWRAQPPIEDLLAWVKKKGVDSFGPDPNPYKRIPKTEERRANEIAWGIARSRIRRRNDRARPWQRATFVAGLNALYDELATGVADKSIEVMKETLLWRMKRSGNKYFQ